MSVTEVALQDIAQHMRDESIPLFESNDGFIEVWNVSMTYLNTPDQKKLNRELGLGGVNKGKHNMTRKHNPLWKI